MQILKDGDSERMSEMLTKWTYGGEEEEDGEVLKDSGHLPASNSSILSYENLSFSLSIQFS